MLNADGFVNYPSTFTNRYEFPVFIRVSQGEGIFNNLHPSDTPINTGLLPLKVKDEGFLTKWCFFAKVKPLCSSSVSPVFLQCKSSELLYNDWAHNGLALELLWPPYCYNFLTLMPDRKVLPVFGSSLMSMQLL